MVNCVTRLMRVKRLMRRRASPKAQGVPAPAAARRMARRMAQTMARRTAAVPE
jgi:hypothetical protein